MSALTMVSLRASLLTATSRSRLLASKVPSIPSLPSHLTGFITATKPTSCMIVGNPFFK